MKKTLISLAAASLVASTAFAADNGIDIKVGGQAAIYYETHDMNGFGQDTDLLDRDNSTASVGIQLDLGADLGNNFTFGSQITYLGTSGLEKNLVNGAQAKQLVNASALVNSATTDELALTKIFLAKQIANTTLKIGRQELPKSLSPLAFSEGWNVFKNTFDAIVAINTDIPKTTLVGAYVASGTGMVLGTTNDLTVVTTNPTLGNAEVDGTAYMITASTTAIPMTTVTASYYHLSKVADAAATGLGLSSGISADAYWLDVAVADKDLPMGLNIGLQAGLISPDALPADVAAALLAIDGQYQTDDTNAYGAKISLAPMDALTLTAAYTSVDGNENQVNVAVKNTGTNIKTPLFTQMVYNQNAIALDADTIMLEAAYNMGDMGTISAAYGMTDAGKANLNGQDIMGNGADYNELDLVYKIKAGGVQYFAAYVMRDIDKGGITNTTIGNTLADTTSDDIVRIWARYNF
jgi:hypothetical protein